MSIRRVVITGGGGFLGRYIVRELKNRGVQVRIVGRKPHNDLEREGVEVCCGDLCDSSFLVNAFRGAQAVFHVAAKAGVWGSWSSYFEPNVLGTRNVLKACLDNKIKYLVYTSTPSVVFNGSPLSEADESLPYGSNWLCHYAHTKSIAEQEVLEEGRSERLRALAIRPHLIWGSGDPHLVPQILERARSGKLKMVGSGDNKVDITHVRNAAYAHILGLDALISGKSKGQAYFVSQGDPVNLWDWINDLLVRFSISPVDAKVSFSSAYRVGFLMEKIYRLFNLKGVPPMTRFLAVELAKDHYFSIEKAKRDLDYVPKTSTEAGMLELVNSSFASLP